MSRVKSFKEVISPLSRLDVDDEMFLVDQAIHLCPGVFVRNRVLVLEVSVLIPRPR